MYVNIYMYINVCVYIGAEYWLEEAEGGDVTAQYELATCYANGRGCMENQNRATFWFKKAAEQNHPEVTQYLSYTHNTYYVSKGYRLV